MTALMFAVLSLTAAGADAQPNGNRANDIESRVTHGYADSGGVKIHYASIGRGPLVVMIHGFPDFWFTWRHQMDALADKFQVVAIDLRGYNLSDKPKGVEQYDMKLLVGDVAAVVRHFKQDKAIIVGHDWGGAIAWTFAMALPEMTDRLIILNLPHLRGLARELAHNPEQQKNSAVRAHLSAARRAFETHRGCARGMGNRSRGQEEVRRSVRPFRLRGHAELLQAQLPSRALRRRSVAGRKSQSAGPDVSRPQGLGVAAARAERDVGLARARSHAGDDPRSQPFRPAGCRGQGEQDDASLAD